MGVRSKPFILCCLTKRPRRFSSAPGSASRRKSGSSVVCCDLNGDVPGLYHHGRAPLPLCFSQVLILKPLKVACFHTFLELLLLKGVRARFRSRSAVHTGAGARSLLPKAAKPPAYPPHPGIFAKESATH